MMPKMKNQYMSMVLSALICFSNSFTVIQAEEETVPEEPEVLETVEEQREREEVSENEVISEQTLSVEPTLDEETVLTDTEMETTEESEIPETMEELQTELFADREDTTWQNDFNYKLENGHLILHVPDGQYSCYKGSSTNVTIPAQAVIDGVSYITELAIMAFYNESTLISLSFEEGVILPEDCANLFGSSQLETLDISRIDTSNVTNMSGMFTGCFVLTSIDVSKFETGNVKNMSSMFQSCNSLKSLDLSALDTRNVIDMFDMFRYSSALAAIDVNGLDTDNVTNMNSMFYDCRSLAAIDISMLNTQVMRSRSLI